MPCDSNWDNHLGEVVLLVQLAEEVVHLFLVGPDLVPHVLLMPSRLQVLEVLEPSYLFVVREWVEDANSAVMASIKGGN